MQDKYKEVLDGKKSLDTLSTEEKAEYNKELQEDIKTHTEALTGIRQGRQAEETKRDEATKAAAEAQAALEKALADKKAADEAAAQGGSPKGDETKTSPEMKQFRDEQIATAKKTLYESLGLSEEERAKADERFKTLDSGKMNAENIMQDLQAAVAAANSNAAINLLQKQRKSEAEAAAIAAAQANAGSGSSGGGDVKPKFSEAAQKLSKDAGITPEAAEKQVKEGMRRVIV